MRFFIHQPINTVDSCYNDTDNLVITMIITMTSLHMTLKVFVKVFVVVFWEMYDGQGALCVTLQ